MKSEHEIAKENVKYVLKERPERKKYFFIALEHLASCERFLEFLKEFADKTKEYHLMLNKKLGGYIISHSINLNEESKYWNRVNNYGTKKIKDLTKAIKLYNEEGIK